MVKRQVHVPGVGPREQRHQPQLAYRAEREGEPCQLERVEDALSNRTHRAMVTGRCYDHQPDAGHAAGMPLRESLWRVPKQFGSCPRIHERSEPKMKADSNIPADARGLRVAIVVSGYHREITEAMEAAATAEFLHLGGQAVDIVRLQAPGAFEIPLLIDTALSRAGIAAAVAIGCIVRGETRHDRHLGQAVTNELARISVARGKPVGLAVLTVENLKQARARAGGDLGNKGAEAMKAALACVRVCEDLRQ